MTTTTPEPTAGGPSGPPAETAPIPTVPETASPKLGEAPEATDESKPSGEAAKYRRQLRDVEAERDGLTERLTTYQTREAERIAGTSKLTAPALWATTTLADLLDEHGDLDPALIDAAVDAARLTLGIPKLPATPGTSGQGEGAAIGGGRTRTFADAFNPNRGRYDD